MDGDIETLTEIAPCKCCGVSCEFQTIKLGGHTFGAAVCPTCIEKSRETALAEQESARLAEVEREWKGICPPLYRDTDPKRLNQDAIKSVMQWKLNDAGMGIALRGESGKGKTRIAFMLLRKLHMEGVRVCAISSTKFARCCADMFSDDYSVKGDAKDKMKQVHKASVLLIDDLGKERFTDRVESELYDLIEERTSHLRPTIWTANVNSDEFASMMSADRGVPIIRRLAEFSEVVTL